MDKKDEVIIEIPVDVGPNKNNDMFLPCATMETVFDGNGNMKYVSVNSPECPTEIKTQLGDAMKSHIQKLFDEKIKEDKKNKEENEKRMHEEKTLAELAKPKLTHVGDKAYASILVGVRECSICGKFMFWHDVVRMCGVTWPYGPFILSAKSLRDAGFVVGSEDDRSMCTDCMADKQFECQICGRSVPKDGVREFCDEKAFCVYCYRTVSAEEWDKQLRKYHVFNDELED